MRNPMLSIVIVNWKTRDYLKGCLDSIKKNVNIEHEVIVVDNNSGDGSKELVKNEYPRVKLIANRQNVGFARGNNAGLKVARGRWVLFLNPDVKVHKDSVERMVDFAEKQRDLGGLGAKLLNPDGTVQKLGYFRRFPTLTQFIFFYSPLCHFSQRVKFLRENFFEHLDFEKIQEIDQPPGACFLVKRSLLKKLQGMDSGFKLYFEDVDLAYRIKKLGYKNYFLPSATFTHFGHASVDQLPYFKNNLLFFRSAVRFFKKHCGRSKGVVIALLIFFIFSLRIVSSFIKVIFGKKKKAHFYSFLGNLKLSLLWLLNKDDLGWSKKIRSFYSR